MTKERISVLIKSAGMEDLDEICEFDKATIQGVSRRTYIKKAISEDRCKIARDRERIVGLVIYDENIFGKVFISLVTVRESKANEGLADFLLNYMKALAVSSERFTIYNKTDKEIEDLFRTKGFVEMGKIEGQESEKIYYYQDPYLDKKY